MPRSEDAASDVHVFLDANILLHYQPPEQIDWPELIGGSAVRLVIYPLLLTELAKAKDLHPVRALRDRARKREAQLRDWLGNRDSPIRAGVLPHRDAREPRDLLAELGLDRDVKDDLIIASAVAYLRQGRRVFVATADGGLEMKLEDHGVAVIRLDERLKLAAERDPEKDRADRAERELRGYLNRLPDIDLSPQKPLVLHRQGPLGTADEYVARRIELVAEQYRQYLTNHPGYIANRAETIHAPRHAAGLGAARDYLAQLHHWLTLIGDARKVILTAENTGTAPATAIRIALHVPAQISVRSSGGLTPPRFPFMEGSPFFHLDKSMPATEYDDWYGDDLRNPLRANALQDPTRIEFAVERLPHHDRRTLGAFHLIAGPEAPTGRKALRGTIHCDEWTQPREITVPFEVYDNDASSSSPDCG